MELIHTCYRIGDGDRLELTYNSDAPAGGYELRSGYGQIAVTVDDLDHGDAADARRRGAGGRCRAATAFVTPADEDVGDPR